MAENKITINELSTRMVGELRRIGYSEETIWRNYHPKIRMVVNYYEREEITVHYLHALKSIALRMNEFYVTGSLRILANKQGKHS